MCRVKCKKHGQCLCECRPLHFQRNYPSIPTHPPNLTPSILLAVEQRQLHARWNWDSYVYRPDTPFGEYGGKLLFITAHKNYRDEPSLEEEIPINAPSPSSLQNHDFDTWNMIDGVNNLNI